MPCIRRNGRPTKVQRLEESAKKNGFKPGVYEKHGLYVGNWENDMKQGESTIKNLKYYVRFYKRQFSVLILIWCR